MKRTGKTITFFIVKRRVEAGTLTTLSLNSRLEPLCVCGKPYSNHPNDRCEKPVDSGI